MKCPRCDVILIPTHATGNRFECPRCNGRLSNTHDIGLLLSFTNANRLIEAAGDFDHAAITCPFCSSRMSPVTLTHELGTMEVDVCKPCVALWTDPGEITKLSKSTITKPSNPDLAAMLPDLAFETKSRSNYYDRSSTLTGGVLKLLWEAFLGI